MKKSRLLLTATCLLGLIQINCAAKLNNGFEESAEDIASASLAKDIRYLQIGEEENVSISKIFVQTANVENFYYIRFSTAIKGNITSVKYTREATMDKAENTKDVMTLYEGIKSNGNVLYYSSLVENENHLTEIESYKGEYYWACYTIKLSSESYNIYKDALINIKIIINEDETTMQNREVTISDAFNNNDQSVISIGANASTALAKTFTILSRNIAVKQGYGSGGACLENIAVKDVIKFYIYSDSEISNADLILRGSSTMNILNAPSGQPNKKEMPVNKSYSLLKQDGTKLQISDEAVFPAGSGWFDFGDVNIGKVDLHLGFNEFTLTCENQQLCPDNSWRTPNIDALKVVVDENNTLICEAENKKSVSLTSYTPNFLIKEGMGNIKDQYVESISNRENGTYNPAKATKLNFYVYCEKDIHNADLYINASSTNLPTSGSVRGDMQFNKIFTVYQNNEVLPIDDTVIVKGGGSTWFDWREVELTKVNLVKGYNVITFVCTDMIKDKDGTGSYRAPNVQSIEVRF